MHNYFYSVFVHSEIELKSSRPTRSPLRIRNCLTNSSDSAAPPLALMSCSPLQRLFKRVFLTPTCALLQTLAALPSLRNRYSFGVRVIYWSPPTSGSPPEIAWNGPKLVYDCVVWAGAVMALILCPPLSGIYIKLICIVFMENLSELVMVLRAQTGTADTGSAQVKGLVEVYAEYAQSQGYEVSRSGPCCGRKHTCRLRRRCRVQTCEMISAAQMCLFWSSGLRSHFCLTRVSDLSHLLPVCFL